MNKYKYIKAHNDYELKVILESIEENNHKLIAVTTFNNTIYVFYEKGIDNILYNFIQK